MSLARWLWVGVAALPLIAGLLTAVVGSTHWCDESLYDGLAEFILVYLGVTLLTGAWGVLAGAVSLRPRGGALAILGALGGGAVGLGWGFFGFLIAVDVSPEIGC